MPDHPGKLILSASIARQLPPPTPDPLPGIELLLTAMADVIRSRGLGTHRAALCDELANQIGDLVDDYVRPRMPAAPKAAANG